MKRVASYILIVILISSQAWADENPCDLTSEAVRQASLIRGLSIKRKTPCLLQDKEEVKKYLLKTINEKIPRQRMESEGLIYKALGFIPADFDYEQGLVKLYLDQLGGYYDPNTD